MREYLYEHWAKMGIVSAVFIIVLLLFYPGSALFSVAWLFWVQVPVYMVHQFEEYVFPGGFEAKLNKILGSSVADFPLDAGKAFWINVPLVWAALTLAAIVGPHAPIVPATLIALSIANGVLHIGVAIRQKHYNPGLIASVVLNIPLGIYTLYRVIKEGKLTALLLIVAILLGVAIHGSLPIYLGRLMKKNPPLDN